MKTAVEVRSPKVHLVFVHLRWNLLPPGLGHVKKLENTHTTRSSPLRAQESVFSSHFGSFVRLHHLWNEEQRKRDCDGDVGVCKGEQQHPVRMERGKGEPGADTQPTFMSLFRRHALPAWRSGVGVYLSR